MMDFGVVQSLNCVQLCDSVDCSITRLLCLPLTPRACSNSSPSSRWCHPTISSSVVHFYSCLRSCPASGSVPMSQSFATGGQSTGASASALVLPWILRTDYLWDWLVWSPCSPRDSQESSPTPQFKSINSSALSFLHSPTLTFSSDQSLSRVRFSISPSN